MTVRDTHSPSASRAPKALPPPPPPPKKAGESDVYEDKEALPIVTEGSVAGSIRLQSRFSDLAETVRLYLDFDDQTKDAEQAHHKLSYFYHREIKYCVFSIARTRHQLEDWAVESLGKGPESLRACCKDIEIQIKEVRDRRKMEDWKGLSKQKKRGAWRKHYEQLLQTVEKSRKSR
ncbi:MAG: hypothetical protein M1830_005994, partial [Pleopsidium flavum]